VHPQRQTKLQIVKRIAMKKGMTKVSVMYPNGENTTFDSDYYSNTHLPLVAELLGNALKASSAEKGIGSMEPGSPAPYAGVGTMYFDSVDDFGKAFGPNAEKILGDLPNFTNIQPAIQISEVM